MLQINRFKFLFKIANDISFPDFCGAAFRGVFGHALKAASCHVNQPSCTGCLFVKNCSYPVLFDPLDKADNKKINLPRPIIMDVSEVPKDLKAGDEFAIFITTLGNFEPHLDNIILAWQYAGALGLGKQKIQFNLLNVEEIELYNPYVNEQSSQIKTCALDLTTPLKATKKLNGRRKNIKPDDFLLGPYLVSILQRINRLQNLYSLPSNNTGVDDLRHYAHQTQLLESNINWQEWYRYSNRQEKKLQMGGITGRIEFKGDRLEKLLPSLWLGQWLHTGNSTMFGLGRYQISQVT